MLDSELCCFSCKFLTTLRIAITKLVSISTITNKITDKNLLGIMIVYTKSEKSVPDHSALLFLSFLDQSYLSTSYLST